MKRIRFGFRIVIALLLILIAFEAFLYLNIRKYNLSSLTDNTLYSREYRKNLVKNFDLNERKQEIDDLINTQGVDKGYSELKNRYSKVDPSETHIMMHLAGEEIYKKIGNRGMTICDPTAAYGCFHGLIVSAILDRGLDVIYELDKTCNKLEPNNLSCQHGIGHGILEYLGNDKLDEALDLCATLSWKGSLLGCQDGVFMGYNFPSAIKGTSTLKPDMRKFNKDPYDPCYKVNKKYAKACFYELPRWWIEVFDFDTANASKFCSNIKEEEYQRSCFIGLGMAVSAFTLQNVEKIEKTCGSIKVDEFKYLCFESSVWAMREEHRLGPNGDQICKMLPSEEEKNCRNSSLILEELYD